jgi:hypothetical protein
MFFAVKFGPAVAEDVGAWSGHREYAVGAGSSQQGPVSKKCILEAATVV